MSRSTTGYGVRARAGASSVISFLDRHARCGATLAVILGAIDAYESGRFCQYVGRNGRLLLTPTPARDVYSRIGARDGSDGVTSDRYDRVDAREGITMYSDDERGWWWTQGRIYRRKPCQKSFSCAR